MILMTYNGFRQGTNLSHDGRCLFVPDSSRIMGSRAMTGLIRMGEEAPSVVGAYEVPLTLQAVAYFVEIETMLDNPDVPFDEIQRVFDSATENMPSGHTAFVIAASSRLS